MNILNALLRTPLIQKRKELALLHQQDVKAELELEKSIKSAKSADRLFNKLANDTQTDTDKLFIDAAYDKRLLQRSSNMDQQTKQSYMSRLKMSKGAVSIIQDDIQKNQAKAELLNKQVLEKYLKKEKAKNEMPSIGDVLKSNAAEQAEVDNDLDVGGFFSSNPKQKLKAKEVISTIKEMGIDMTESAHNPKLPNPFANSDDEDYVPDQVMGYRDVMTNQAYTLYNLPWDGKTEKMNARDENTQKSHMIGNQQIDMNKVYRLAGNRKIQGEKLEMRELDNKAQMADQQHIQKHLAVYHEIAVSGHKADRLAEESEISKRSKSKNQMTHLMNEAIRNKERLEYFWADSKEGAKRAKMKYGWGFGYIA